MSELRDLDQTAVRLHVSRRTVYREIKAKRLRVVKVRGSSFVTDDEIERYIKSAERPRRVA